MLKFCRQEAGKQIVKWKRPLSLLRLSRPLITYRWKESTKRPLQTACSRWHIFIKVRWHRAFMCTLADLFRNDSQSRLIYDVDFSTLSHLCFEYFGSILIDFDIDFIRCYNIRDFTKDIFTCTDTQWVSDRSAALFFLIFVYSFKFSHFLYYSGVTFSTDTEEALKWFSVQVSSVFYIFLNDHMILNPFRGCFGRGVLSSCPTRRFFKEPGLFSDRVPVRKWR